VYLLQGEDEQQSSEIPSNEETSTFTDEKVKKSSGDPNDSKLESDEEDNDDFLDEKEPENDEYFDSSDEDKSGASTNKKRRLIKHGNSDQKKLKQEQREKEIQEYYKYCWCASHSAGIAFSMSRDLYKDDKNILWYVHIYIYIYVYMHMSVITK
ncbi:hypothetical protein RFI_06829, partial [Reticulomyxa filosa]